MPPLVSVQCPCRCGPLAGVTEQGAVSRMAQRSTPRGTMPTLTNYWFSDTDFRGNTEFLNVGHCAGCWAWINWSNIGPTDSTLVWEREDREVVIDLPPILNAPDILDAVDRLLSGPVRRTSDLLAGWIPWKHVVYYGNDPGRHGDLDLLIRIRFNFHVSTPWYCSDADGDI